MAICPQCLASGYVRNTIYTKIVCPLCDGRLEVSSLELARWHLEHPHSPLPTKILSRKDGVTLLPCPICFSKPEQLTCELCNGEKKIEPIVLARWEKKNREQRS